VLDGADPIERVEIRTRDAEERTFLVRLAPSGWAAVSRDLIERLVKEGKGALTLASVLPAQRLPYLYPDLAMDAALRCVTQ